MTSPFNTAPVRAPARPGRSSDGIKRSLEGWPATDRDTVDVALVAARMLSVSGRLRTGLRRAARRLGVPQDLVLLLLLFSEGNRWLRVVDIAEFLGVGHASASRLATRAETAGLIDKRPNPLDQREVGCRLSVAGRDAVAVCLDAVRPVATDVLRPPDRAWISQAQDLLERSIHFDPITWNRGHRAGERFVMWPPE